MSFCMYGGRRYCSKQMKSWHRYLLSHFSMILASSFRNTAKRSTLVTIRGSIEPRKLKILAVHNSTDYCDCVPTQPELTSGCEKYEKQNTREGSIDVAAVVRLNQGQWHHTVSGRPCGREETHLSHRLRWQSTTGEVHRLKQHPITLSIALRQAQGTRQSNISTFRK
jgi:hypothetical protein